jgi:hypothetical protein
MTGPLICFATACTASKSPWKTRENGLDYIDAEIGKRLGYLELLGVVQRSAGRLFAVA